MARIVAVGVALTPMAGSAAARALDAPAERQAIVTILDRDYSRLDTLYKAIHRDPELALREVRTAARLAREMRGLGFDVTEKVGGTGVVALYRNGPGPIVLVRTELDALPMEEKTGLAYASRAKTAWKDGETYVAHSCGHDIHMAAWVGTARVLLAEKAKWHGTLMFVAQPAEEALNGAQGMVDAGLFTRFPKPDFGFALHDGPDAAGTISYKSGTLTATSDGLDITFVGRGGHGSAPSITIDPVLMAGRFIVDVQSVVSREKVASAFGVVTIGSVHAGTAGNIIPDRAQLTGTIRSWDEDVRAKLLLGVRRTARAVADMAGAPEPIVKLDPGAKAVFNDPALAARTGAMLKAAFGADVTETTTITSGSEDYSVFVAAGVPSFYFGIGALDGDVVAKARAAGAYPAGPHDPAFAPLPEPTIRTGVTAMTLAVMNVMTGE